MPASRILLLPGLGADSRLYGDEIRSLSNINLINWPDKYDFKTLPALARYLIERYEISNKDIVGGTSLGGMVSLEIAKLRKIKNVVVISSCLNSREINPFLARARKLSKYVPVEALKISSGKAGSLLDINLLEMFSNVVEEDFLRNMISAVFEWEGIGDYDVNMLRIHGEYDLVIPCPKDESVFKIDGGHLISTTHAGVIADEILAFAARL